MKKKSLIIFIVLLAVVFLATSSHAGGRKYIRWWKYSFHYVWKSISDLRDRVEKLEENTTAPAVTTLCPGCSFYDLSVVEKDFSGAYLAGAFIYNTDLIRTNLSGADLSGANFYNATLTETNFTNANLTGAYFTNTVLTDCIWDSTICPDGTNSDANDGTCLNNL